MCILPLKVKSRRDRDPSRLREDNCVILLGFAGAGQRGTGFRAASSAIKTIRALTHNHRSESREVLSALLFGMAGPDATGSASYAARVGRSFLLG
jgi:hypothetical protein